MIHFRPKISQYPSKISHFPTNISHLPLVHKISLFWKSSIPSLSEKISHIFKISHSKIFCPKYPIFLKTPTSKFFFETFDSHKSLTRSKFIFKMGKIKLKFVKGHSSLTVSMTAKLTMNIRFLLKNRFKKLENQQLLEKLIILHTKTYFVITSINYQCNFHQQSYLLDQSVCGLHTFEVIFLDELNRFHHISLTGLSKEEVESCGFPIFYNDN